MSMAKDLTIQSFDRYVVKDAATVEKEQKRTDRNFDRKVKQVRKEARLAPMTQSMGKLLKDAGL